MNYLKSSILFGLCLMLFVVSCFSQKLSAEEILAKHLDSIGKSAARVSTRSRVAVGDAQVTFVSQKNQKAQGRIVLASTAEKNFLGLNLNAADYPSEKFSYDGNKAKVGFVRIGERSILGNFILTNDFLLEESLLGGTLSSSWALLNLPAKKAFKQSEWNKVRIECIGNTMRTFINDIPASHLVDDMTRKGFIALQVHSVRNPEDAGKQVRLDSPKPEETTPQELQTAAVETGGWKV